MALPARRRHPAPHPPAGLSVAHGATGSVAPGTLDHIRQGSGRIIFTASGVNEESLESDTTKHGYFTCYLVQALQLQNGTVPLSQAFAYVQQHVRARAQTEALAEQNPVLSRSQDSTDFSLGTPGAASARVEQTHAAASAE